MTPSDKALSKLSAAFTLVVLVGILSVPFLPIRHLERRSAVPRPAASAPSKPVQEHADADAQTQDESKQHEPESADGSADAAADAKTEELTVWSEVEQADALRSCVKLLAPLAVEVEMADPMRKGQCGAAAPVMLHSIGDTNKITLEPAPEMNCRLVAALARWVETVLQPAAREVMGSRVTHIVGASSYACRNIYNRPTGTLSEHATANAVDISAFSLADGRMIRVVKGWGPTERDIAAARKKMEEAKRAKSGDAKAESAKQEDAEAGKANDAKTAKSKKAVQKTRLETRSTGKVIPATATLTAAKTTEAAFLKRLHHGACGVFATVLGPEANEAHRDHFHFDMKERKSSRRYCH